ncbi:hypothetical protein MKW94_015318 [Papaver nudicaule]|uniref:3'-5' exonuclease domain-containing protein n=1 Tax=Papaver nudicaule TaxID=74823 RepID=A0AA41V1B4_PAPNU|nr:hypothetical protein [Papaver nudicaule]
MKTVGVSVRELPNYDPDAQELYSVTFGNERIKIVVTKMSSTVDDWIKTVYGDNKASEDDLIVGFDVDWKPAVGVNDNPVATLHLCVGHRCLIFQIMRADKIPKSLHGFLQDEKIRFIGVGIQKISMLECC